MGWFLLFALAFAALVVALKASRRVDVLSAVVESLRRETEFLRRQLAESRRGKAPSEADQAEEQEPSAPPAEVAMAAPAPVLAGPEIPPVAFEVVAASPAGSPPAPSVAPEPPVAPPASAPLSQPPPARFDWESFVGVKLFSWIAAIFLALAAAYFFREAVQRGLLGPPLRMALGLLAGAGLIVGCELKAARRYPVTANALDAAGIAILFSTFFASHARWHLLGTATTFLLMALVTVVAVALSIRRDSLFIALLGLFGGFATPALLATGEDHPIGLFGYLLLLNAGLAWVAYHKKWPFLSVLSLVFTTLYQWGWVARFLDDTKLGLAAGIFLVFPVLSLVALGLGERREGKGPTFEKTAVLSAALPLLFAVFFASVPAYGTHTALLFGFLLLVDAGLAAVAMFRDAEALHAAGALATLVVLAVWVGRAPAPLPYLPAVLFTALFVLLYLASPLIALRLTRPFSGIAAPAVYVAPLLLFVYPVLTRMPAAAEPLAVFAVLLALTAAVSGASALQGRPGLHILGVFFAFVAQATWAETHLSPGTLLPGLAVFAAFALLFFAVPPWTRRLAGASRFLSGPAGYFGLSGHVLVLLVVAGAKDLAVPPGPMLGILAVLDVAALVTSFALARPGVLTAALAGTQLSLIVFSDTAPAAPWPATALLSAVAAGAFSIGAYTLAKKRAFGIAPSVTLLLGPFVALAASLAYGSPGVGPHVAAQVFFLAALVGIAWATEWHVLAVLGAVPAAAAAFAWRAGRTGNVWREELLLAGATTLVLVLNPILLGRRAGQRREPYVAVVLSGVAFFFLARQSLTDGGFTGVIGLLPLALAGVMALLLLRLRSLGIPPAQDAARLALVAGTMLGFVTVAIPLQLEKEWITIGWAVLGAALAWLWTRIPHRGLLAFVAGLFVAVFVRLAFNPAVLTYHARARTPVWNWFLYTYAIPAIAFYAAAVLLRKRPTGAPRALLVALPTGGTILLFLLLNIEIADFYSTGRFIAFNFFSATLAEGLAYTLGWALFALVLLITGLALKSRPTRIASLALLVATVLKGFVHDLGRLGGLYRVASLVGLAVSLALVALLLQRFVLARRETP